MKKNFLITMLLVATLLFSTVGAFADYGYLLEMPEYDVSAELVADDLVIADYVDSIGASNFLGITPFTIMPNASISIYPEELFGFDVATITLTYTVTAINPITFDVILTNGAEFLVNSTADVTFQAGVNGMIQNATSVNVAGDTMTITTPPHGQGWVPFPILMNQRNTITFPVEVPLMASSFNVSIHPDTPGNFGLSGGIDIAIQSDLTIEPIGPIAPYTVVDIVDDVTPFIVHGNALIRGEEPPPGSIVVLEMLRLLTDGHAEMFPEAFSMVPVVDGQYSTEIALTTPLESGYFLIRAFLMLPCGNIRAFAQREVRFNNRPDVLRITLSRDNGGQVERIDPEEWRIDRNFPAAVTDRLFLRGVVVGWQAIGFPVLPGSPVTATVEMKDETVVQNAAGATFVLHTTFGQEVVPAGRTGNTFVARFDDFSSKIFLASGGRPYVELHYNHHGEPRIIRLGYLDIIIDPAGTIYDAETMEPVEGATVTLYRLNGEVINGVANGFWSRWVSHNNQINPQITAADGAFAWDVEDGWYDIRVDHPDFGFFLFSIHSGEGYLEVPPERLGLVLVLHRIATPDGLTMEVFDQVEFAQLLENFEESR